MQPDDTDQEQVNEAIRRACAEQPTEKPRDLTKSQLNWCRAKWPLFDDHRKIQPAKEIRK